jgi:hypothetical protein
MKELLSAEALAEIKKFNRNVEWLKLRELKQTTSWVRANVILNKTGWSRSQLATARNNGYINYKLKKKSFFYNPDSINKDYLAATKNGLKE